VCRSAGHRPGGCRPGFPSCRLPSTYALGG